MKIINSCEIFGLPGSGKTFLRDKLKKKIENKGYIVLNNREVITKYLKFFCKTTLIDKIYIKYFSLSIKVKNPKNNFKKNFNKIIKKKKLTNNVISNIVRKGYYNLCKKCVKQNYRKSKFLDIIEKNFSNHQKKIYLERFYELLAAVFIFNKISRHKKKIYFFPDEGLIQKIYILGKLRNKNIKKIIKNYVYNMPVLNDIIYLKANTFQIEKVNSFRKKNLTEKYQKKNFIKNYYLIEKEILKYEKKIKFKKLYSKLIFKNYKNDF